MSTSKTSGLSKMTRDKNQRILLELVSQPGNDVCADCKAKAPRWASHNLGIFICVHCASIHRKIGTHITKVKSLTLDDWTKEQVENMKAIGNIKANQYWNPDEKKHPLPTNMEESERDSELEKYIRSKYEFQRFRPLSNSITVDIDAAYSSPKALADRPYSNFLMLGQNRTEAILRAHLENCYHIRVNYGTTLVAFEQNENSVTTHLVRTSDDGGDAKETLNVGWLIGADESQPVPPTSLPWHVKPSPDIPYSNFLMLGQDRTEAILRAHLENCYHIRVNYGTTLVAFEQNENSVTTHLIRTSDDGGDAKEILNVGWLIGADGSIRKHLGLTYFGETRDNQKFITGDVHVRSGLNRHRTDVRPSDSFGLHAKDYGMHESQVRGIGPRRRLEARRISIYMYMFSETDSVDLYRPNIRMANNFSKGRVFIAGDAAHIHCTSGGQGVVSCVQDVMNLCWKLALVECGVSSPTLLSTYDEERRPVIKDMLSITTAIFDQIVTGKVTAWPKSLLDLRQFGVNYRWSSIIVDDRPDADPVGTYDATLGKPHAGDRAPEAPGLIDVKNTTKTSVFKMLVSFRHTVLVFTDTLEEATPFINELKRTPASMFKWAVILPQSMVSSRIGIAPSVEGLLLIDYDNHAYTNYLPDESRRVAVIRPDGVIGALTGSPIGLQKYLELIFVA
ncbi:hypothetical protein A7U60_g5348 [Sanghuangporus baumii]|uniref:Arf-GAP domain-containing protein n=1 Tax=Sanghuangporus baumii TaxID=108892 RepID=A0A9Q5HWR5_SANBA|nr:hypothetical protein A7U60_g5348 [Sanghuangporus baumii]